MRHTSGVHGMSFNVTFYKSTANPLQLDKTPFITQIGTALTSSSKHTIDIINPVFTVDFDADLLSANYCYIEEYGRYYFCHIETDTAQKIIVHCAVDVLHTYADKIATCYATIIRAEQSGINYVVDNQLPIDSRRVWLTGSELSGDPLKINSSWLYKYLLITNT